ncbi:MAG: hypothetical protein IT291_09210 [Deltaproteobacteria bacterium]|nr:hypothetical protein [Deltaproteobacteria bacterium]
MDDEVRKYLVEIGRRGGTKSRRSLSTTQAQSMVRLREAKRAFKKFRTACFWSYDPNLKITAADIHWIAEQLRKHGNRQAWEIAERLCR